MAEALTINIDTGIETVEIKNELGDVIGSFRFNPSDTNMAYRAEEAIAAINNLKIDEEKLRDLTSPESKEFCKFIGQQFDFVLGFEVADDIFRNLGVLSLVRNGDYYFEKAFEGIVGYVEKVTKQRVNKKLTRINKATAKYKKR